MVVAIYEIQTLFVLRTIQKKHKTHHIGKLQGFLTNKACDAKEFPLCFTAVITTRVYLHVQIAFFNPLKPELNPICYLLALLGAHHFLHVSRIRVKLLTFR